MSAPVAPAPRYNLDAIRAALPMLDLCQREGIAMERSASVHVGQCPFHAGRRKTFTVSDERPDCAHCYGASCGWDGDVFQFFRDRHGVDFPAAVAALAGMAGLAPLPPGAKIKAGAEPRTEKPRPAMQKPEMPELRPLTDDEQARLANLRGVSLAGVKRAIEERLVFFSYWPLAGNGEADSRTRAAWCVTDDSRLTAAFRRMDGAPWFEECKSWNLKNARWPVGVASLRGRSRVLLVEGGPDMLAAWHIIEMHGEAEHVAVVAMLGGATLAPEALELLQGCQVRIIADHDEPVERTFAKQPPITVRAGLEAAGRWLHQLRDVGIAADVVNLGALGLDGVKDLNDLVKAGLDGLDTGALLWLPASPEKRAFAIMQTTRPQRCRAVEWREIGAESAGDADTKFAGHRVSGEVREPQERTPASVPRKLPPSRGKKAAAAAAEPGGDGGAESGEGGVVESDVAAICERNGINCENRKERNWYARIGGELAPFSTGELAEYLFVRGEVRLKPNREAGERVSEFARLKVYAYEHCRVDVALPGYAGYPAGVHVCGGNKILAMKSPDLIEPREGPWPTIQAFIRGLLPPDGDGIDQAEIFLAWLQMAVRAVRGEPRSGQLLILIGKKGDGKGRLQHFVITPLLGGRSADPIPFLLGESNFNDELIGTEHLLSEDPAASVKKDERNKFKQKLKAVAVNDCARFHPKHRAAVTLKPVWRMSISLNDGPDDLAILPPPSSDWTEKTVMLATRRPSYLPGAGEAERREWREKLAAEKSAFLHYLLHVHETPEEYRGDRFGCLSYENPSIRAHLLDGAPWAQLLAEIDDWAPWTGQPGGYHKAKLHELEASLTSTARDAWQSTERLLKRHSLAYLLRQIQAEHPERVSKSRTGTKGGGRYWLLWAPQARQASGAAAVEAAESEAQTAEASDEL
jgi:hypothetical protein